MGSRTMDPMLTPDQYAAIIDGVSSIGTRTCLLLRVTLFRKVRLGDRWLLWLSARRIGTGGGQRQRHHRHRQDAASRFPELEIAFDSHVTFKMFMLNYTNSPWMQAITLLGISFRIFAVAKQCWPPSHGEIRLLAASSMSASPCEIHRRHEEHNVADNRRPDAARRRRRTAETPAIDVESADAGLGECDDEHDEHR